MKMEQVYTLLNTVTQEILGETAVVAEDLSNVVDIGQAFEDAAGLDNYVRSLVDHIGKVVFVDRIYNGRAPSVLMDGWEFGSILEKIRVVMPSASENASWQLTDGQDYPTNIFHAPTVSAKFFNDRVTYEVKMSFTEKQVKSSFSSAMQLNGFMSMIYSAINNSMTVKNDALIMRTINAAIGETLHAEYATGAYSASSGTRAVNLLYLYNQKFNQTLTPAAAITDANFIRFASFVIKNYMRRMQGMSKLFNIEGTEKFTPADRMHVVMLDEFKNAAEVYLYDGLNQFNTEGIKLPASVETVDYWQGSGLSYAFADTSAINITTPSEDEVTASGILGVIFDRDALGVANIDRRVRSHYVESAEFWNEWHKADAQYFLDLSENIVVFFVA